MKKLAISLYLLMSGDGYMGVYDTVLCTLHLFEIVL